MLFTSRVLAFYTFLVIPIVLSFSPDTSSYDAYGLKLAVNEILLVESLPSDSSFLLRLAPFNYSLSCKIPYIDSNQYVYAVALASQATYDDSIRFVFIGVHTKTNVPFIGSLTYTGVTGPTYLNAVNGSRRAVFPCDGWQSINYRVHQFNQFASDGITEGSNNDFFVVTVA